MNFKDIAEGIEAIATTLGIVGAGGFFLFKALYGYSNLNCSLSVQCERQKKNDNTDFVSAMVTIDKGPNTAMSLLHGEVRFVPCNTPQKPEVLQLCRLETNEETATGVSVKWERIASERALFVSPGEKMHFSCFAEVPRNVPCHVEAVILGRKRLWRKNSFLAQWRASAISLPKT